MGDRSRLFVMPLFWSGLRRVVYQIHSEFFFSFLFLFIIFFLDFFYFM